MSIKKKAAFLLIVLVGYAFSAVAQEESIRVIQDPMFWKLDLRLTKKQCDEIEHVNADFYSTLINSMSDKQNDKPLELSSLLQQRSDSIWDILTSRQKTKWQKIEEARYSVKTARRTRIKLL